MKLSRFILIPLFAILAFSGCKNNAEEDEQAAMAHTHVSKSHTLFNDDLELFAEIDSFTKGHGSSFLIHLTNLHTYKPIINGQVTISIKGAQTNFNTIIQTPSSPGIYRANFAAEFIEKVILTIGYQGQQFSSSFNLGEFSVYGSDEEAEKAFATSSEQHEGDEIIFTKEQVWEIEFSTVELQAQPFNNVIPVSGQIEALPKNVTSVIAPSGGIIQFAQNLMPGQKVKKGDILFTVNAGQLTSNNLNTKYNSEKVTYEKAKSDLERAEKLIKENIISEKDYLQVKLDFDNAKLNFESISKNFSNGSQVVRATQSGIISELMIKAGDFVDEGQQLGRIIFTDRLILKANLPQNRFDEAGKIISANFKTTFSNEVYSTTKLNGKVLSYSITPSADNAYLPVFFEIDNPGSLAPGLFAEIYLESKLSQEVLSIPISALIESEGHFHVYVQEDGEGYTSHDVKIGSNNGNMVVISEGLKIGDRIVTKGAYRIKLASLAGELPSHGHVH